MGKEKEGKWRKLSPSRSEMREDGCPLQATEQLPAPLGSFLQIRPEELEEALKRSTTLPTVVEDVVMKKAIPTLVKEFRALIPVIVKDVLNELGHISSSRCLPHHANSSTSRSFQLRFVGIFPKVLFTFDNIQPDEGAPLQVVLEDNTGSRVHVGLEAFVKIGIFVLDGDFEVEDMDDWTDQDFDKKLAQPRKDKGSLLRGEREIYLSNGVASISDIAFTDNSNSMRNGKFRLGARVVKGLPPEVKIRDAVSAAFKVKERRGKSYRKHKSVSLEDGILCLKNIGKTLYERLAKRDILTVRDFLQLYNTDANDLRNILNVAENKWSEIVKNAKLCSLTDEQYRYCDEASETDLLLDCVFNVIRVVFNGRISQPYKDLADFQKEQVSRVRLAAYKERKELPRITPANLTSMQVALADTTTTIMPSRDPSIDQMANGQNVLSHTVNQTDQGGQDGGLRLGLVSCESEMHIGQTEDSHSDLHKPTGAQDVLLCPPDQTGPHMPLMRELPTMKAVLHPGGQSLPSSDLQAVALASYQLPAASTRQTNAQHPDAATTIVLSGNPSNGKMRDGHDWWSRNQTDQGGQDGGLRLGLLSPASEMNTDQTEDSHFELHKRTGQGEQDAPLCPADQTGLHVPLTRELLTMKAVLPPGGQSLLPSDLQAVALASCQLPGASTPQTNVQQPDAATTTVLGGNPSGDKMRDTHDWRSCTPNQTAQGGQDSLPNFEAGPSPSLDMTSSQSQIDFLLADLFGDTGIEPFPLESHTNGAPPMAYAAVDPMSQSNVGSCNREVDLFSLREFMLNDTGPMACRVNMVEDTMPQSNAGSNNMGADQFKLVDSMNGAQVHVQPMAPGANVVKDPMSQSNVGFKRKRVD